MSKLVECLPAASRRRPDRLFFLLLAVALSTSLAPRSAAAQSAGDDRLFGAYLAAGEFGPAQRLAQSSASGEERDRMLGEIAAAQAALGMRSASLATTSTIADDAVRSRLTGQIAAQPVRGWTARGGGVQADFDSLIELITSTIAPQSWDVVGGPGAIQGFEGGCYVDSAGLLKRAKKIEDSGDLIRLRSEAARDSGNRDVRRAAPLRKVSLRRLEKQLQMRHGQRLGPDESMRALAGLTRIKFLFIYPETGDVVLAGPAGDWKRGPEGRRVSVESGAPVAQLDDFVVLLRNALHADGRFGCSITPTRQGLAATQQFLEESGKQALRPSERDDWLEELRSALGQQDIEVYGVDPRTRVARILVEADYRMKLVGMGLEPGVLGVVSYLDSIPADAPPPSMDVLRWWFTLNYQAVLTTETGHAFQLRGPGVKVLSENELLTEQGERRPTGKSDALNQQFAQSFTRHFERLAAQYPVYAELRNVFDLAVVAGLLGREDVREQLGWPMAHFDDPRAYVVPLDTAPRRVESVVNHRLIDRRRIVAGVSGGVAVDTRPLVARQAMQVDDYGLLRVEHRGAESRPLDETAWWWD